MQKKKPVRITAVVTPDEMERIRYWAESHDVSVNEYVRLAVERAIRNENRDYDLPTLEIARLNQLVEAMNALSANVSNLEHIVVDTNDQFVRLTRGENYLNLGSADLDGVPFPEE